MDDRPSPTDADKTEQLTPPSKRSLAAASHAPGERRPAERWSTVFTVFAAIALVALLLLGAAVISSQPLAAPSTSPSPSPSPSPSISLTPAPRTAAPTEAPTRTPTAAPTTAAPTPARTTARPSLPLLSLTVLPTRTP